MVTANDLVDLRREMRAGFAEIKDTMLSKAVWAEIEKRLDVATDVVKPACQVKFDGLTLEMARVEKNRAVLEARIYAVAAVISFAVTNLLKLWS